MKLVGQVGITDCKVHTCLRLDQAGSNGNIVGILSFLHSQFNVKSSKIVTNLYSKFSAFFWYIFLDIWLNFRGEINRVLKESKKSTQAFGTDDLLLVQLARAQLQCIILMLVVSFFDPFLWQCTVYLTGMHLCVIMINVWSSIFTPGVLELDFGPSSAFIQFIYFSIIMYKVEDY